MTALEATDPFLSTQDSPVSKLNRDILWSIFSLSSTDQSWYSPENPESSTLWTIRRCSQVCTSWRQIILDSPSIWGHCIDLDLLRQERGDWRNEVLRRTGNAPLCVKARYEKPVVSGTAVHEFLLDLIEAHWERIQIFDVEVQSEETLDDARAWSAFSRPAPCLQEFSLFSVTTYSPETSQRQSKYPTDFHLFSGTAPVIAQFSIHSRHRTILPIATHPFPPVLLNPRLHYLSLIQPNELAASDMFVACEQLVQLELLEIVISRLIPDDPHNAFVYSRRKVTLPRLRAITIIASSPNLDIFPEFLGHIAPHPGCSLSVETTLPRTGPQFPASETAKIQKMLDTFLQYSNTFFDHYREGQHPVKDLSLGVMVGSVNFTTYRHRYYLRFMGAQDEEIPEHILDMALRTLASIKFPSTVTQLKLFLVPDHPPISSATLSKLLLRLGSVSEISTQPRTLSYIHDVSTSEDTAVLPLLKVIFLRALDGLTKKEQHIKPFLASRQSINPVEILNLTRSRWPLGDLRFLDEINGLKVVWMQDEVLTEYVCGSGNAEILSLGSDEIDLSDSDGEDE